MRRNGSAELIDASFTIDPDDCGQDNVVERDGWRISGCPGFLGIALTVPPESFVPAGEYRFTWDEWDDGGSHYDTLADCLDAIQSDLRQWVSYLAAHRATD